MAQKTAFTHSEVREKLCLICRTSKNWKKGSIKKILPDSVILNRVRLYYHATYDPADLTLPNALCSRDKQLLLDISKGLKEKSELRPPVLWPRDFYPPGDFGSKTDCLCPLCRIVRAKVEVGHDLSSNEAKKPFPRGRPWPSETSEAPEASETVEVPEALEALEAVEAPAHVDAPEAMDAEPVIVQITDQCCAVCTKIWDESTEIMEQMSIPEIKEKCNI